MPGESIYVPSDERFGGSSPQYYYETAWVSGRKKRLRKRLLIGVAGMAFGVWLGIRFGLDFFLTGLVVGGGAAFIDFLVAWRAHERTAVWRGKRRGQDITGPLLRLGLNRRGYRVMDGRAVPGAASIDHLVIGPNGVWIVDNEAWEPGTYVAKYGERLFFGEKYGTSMAKDLIKATTSLAEMLREQTGLDVSVAPVLAVHGAKIESRSGVLSGEGLTVAYPRKVARWIRSQSDATLTPEQIDLLARTAALMLRRMF
ncbi:nuclease-related domain-containing protein [Thermobispora bispora]|uniref:NERD domain-containing protein n=1 Tax=Thermobispora bispora (strain ATCC 19993 / DSM 43833 / CBS 139.67 / JCM 10125 / KCTC 9307 / NBRC 14880 / R51) TaxID=469371 RepID=D6Y5K1_THEBD|nr:nuclease-related domain-containing protein [Thermobispora bispora]ADG89396.1 hypothetical protein Tbis_2695 [Thermobispora bispora DSM 43833]